MSPQETPDLAELLLPPPAAHQQPRPCRLRLGKRACLEVKLGAREEVPDYQQRPHISAGYRLHTRGCWKCVRTLAAVHNETVNIWTHLLGLVPVAFWAFSLPTRVSDAYETFGMEVDPWTGDTVALMVLYAMTVNCLFFSAVYHLRHCDEESINYGCFYLDITGVILLIIATEGCGVWICMRCLPWAQLIYGLGVMAKMPVMALAVYGNLSDGTRAAVFAVCGLLGLVPAAHWSLMAPSSDVAIFMPYVLGMLACFCLGAALYGARFPESRWPGCFDFCGQSHNLWHLCVLAGMVVTLNGMERMTVLYASRPTC